MSTDDGKLEQKIARLTPAHADMRPDRELAWRATDSCDEACRVARRSALEGVILSLLLLVAILAMMHLVTVQKAFGQLINFITLFGYGIFFVASIGLSVIYVFVIGEGSGRLAHRFAYETDISATTLARLIAWVANLCLWGWAVVLVFIVLTHP